MNGYFDLQINGYAGIDFNAPDLTLEDLHAACAQLKLDGVDGILLTLITDAIPSLKSKISRIVKLCGEDSLIAEMVRGLHIEGPFLSPEPGYIGAHPTQFAQRADLKLVNQLLDAGQGMVKIVTLAPEMDPGHVVTRALADSGVVVAAGHSNASLDELQGAIDAGLCMFTHLGNGCPMEMNRHDNIISRVLSLSSQLWISFIADGAHIPFFVLQNYLRLTGLEKVIVVTDAISAAGCPPGIYQLGGRSVCVGEDGVPRAESGKHLVGSGATMPRMAENLREELLLSTDQIDLLTRRNPCTLMALAVTTAVS